MQHARIPSYNKQVKRAISLLKRVGIENDIAFVGGVAKNIGMRHIFKELLDRDVFIPQNPQIIGALGCAISGMRYHITK